MEQSMQNNLESAREWLLQEISAKTNLFDFTIIDAKKVRCNAYRFNVRYKWQLNAWTKNVTTEIVVVWIKDKNAFGSTFPFLGGE